ncbi:MAG: thiamine phosphate synthase [Chloroflexi bacterium]|nr:thiamine phosphate synthase [Chloroflexota bacterium]
MDWSVYVITDAALSRGRSHLEVIEAAIRGGATVVQYREKSVSTRQMIKEGEALQELCRAHGIPLFINDRVDIALAIKADGVHVGQEDMPAVIVRRLVGPEVLIGVSAETVELARQAAAEGADYLGAGSVFATSTKADAGVPIGLDRLAAIVKAMTVPVVAIGGINTGNAADVIRAGAAGVAVVSAVVAAKDVEAATRALHWIVKSAS